MTNYLREHSGFRIFVLFSAFSLLHLLTVDVLQNQNILRAEPVQVLEAKLQAAEESYYAGDFRQTIDLIKDCLQDPDLTEPTKMKAYAILARTFFTQGDESAAKEVVRKILNSNPDYLPTIEQERPQFISMVEQVREEQQSKQTLQANTKGGINWLWIGAGGVAAAAVIVLIASGGSDGGSAQNSSLPSPPPFPE